MTEPVLLHESIVDAAEIDSLGHLNVRYYGERANLANLALLKLAGIKLQKGQFIRWTDTFNRFHREQFEGARLQTYGGFISAEETANKSTEHARAYFEIRNADSKTLAASFVVAMNIVDSLGHVLSDLNLISVDHRSDLLIELPAHGAPRTINLREPRRVSLEEIEAIELEDPTPGMMSGRREGLVLHEDCDAEGRLREDVNLMYVLHRLQPGQELSQMGPPITRDDHGRRFSWAMLETRSYLCDRPIVNDIVVSIGADLSTGEKWRYTRRWMFAKKSGLLLAIYDSVGICIDLDARKSIVIPRKLKITIDANCVPQFL
ncbi:MAG: acyl-CoA thioester hydrolase [Candidatus Azotimanducaceae bacterium]|jgi:acyl-CoA thioester hydrolase